VPTGERLQVEVEDAAACSRFVARWVADVTVGPSPDRVQMRLLSAGMRPISNVVDASNYVMLELGKPIHTFDAAAIHDGRIMVRRARGGERLTTLDHVERELHPDTLLIADPVGPLGLAGVMGGAASEVSTGTRDVVVESAIFDPISIRRTAFRYALRSEASLRFEKGQEHRLARIGADRTARLLAEWAGGIVAPGAIDTNDMEPVPARVAFRPARVNRLLGTSLDAGEQVALLARMGIGGEAAADRSLVEVPVAAGDLPLLVAVSADDVRIAVVPSWRRDLAIEADITEEIARIHGYERIPGRRPETPMPAFRASPLEVRNGVRHALVGAGLTEVVTHALVPPAQVRDVAWARPSAPAAGEDAALGSPITVTNPLSADHATLRQAMVGSLLEVAGTNERRGRQSIAIFEVGKGYGREGDEAHEWWRLGLALGGPFDERAWNRPARVADLDDAKGLVELIATRLGLEPPDYTPVTDEPLLHPGRAANVVANDASGAIAISGRVGELHPRAADAAGLRIRPVIVAELSIRGLSGGSLPVPRATAQSRFPDVERDLAIVVDRARASADLATVIRTAAGPLLRDVTLFDVYRGNPLAESEQSAAFRLRFASADRTLTEDEVDAAVATIVEALGAAGGRIRG
ncbi:MAG: phenylalanine--tRNA ligase subunit beta, partial [Candidatus Limnocylindrales bacterium]